MDDFEQKHYTNPTLMWRVLDNLGLRWRLTKPPRSWPAYGLARVQWEGPWTAPGVPERARYRHTHWVGACARNPDNVGIFDINQINNGTGWSAVSDWVGITVPYLTEHTPRANGRWHLTHVVEVER